MERASEGWLGTHSHYPCDRTQKNWRPLILGNMLSPREVLCFWESICTIDKLFTLSLFLKTLRIKQLQSKDEYKRYKYWHRVHPWWFQVWKLWSRSIQWVIWWPFHQNHPTVVLFFGILVFASYGIGDLVWDKWSSWTIQNHDQQDDFIQLRTSKFNPISATFFMKYQT